MEALRLEHDLRALDHLRSRSWDQSGGLNQRRARAPCAHLSQVSTSRMHDGYNCIIIFASVIVVVFERIARGFAGRHARL